MTDPIHPGDDADALAAELALRVLSPAEEAAAAARADSDPAFAAQVDAWNTRLAALAEEAQPVQPSAALWPRVEAGLAPPAIATPAPAVAASAANDNDRVTFWRRWAMASTGLLAASLVAVVVLANSPEPTAPSSPVAPPAVTRVATLTLQGEGSPAMTLAYDSQTGALYLAPTNEMAGDSRVPHLWLMRPDQTVVLVGAIDPTAPRTHSLKGTPLSDLAASGAVAVAVSMEAPGHTPAANKPDGPVVASGELQRL